MEVLIYSEYSSNRFNYVLDWIFSGVSSYKITRDFKAISEYDGPAIIYGKNEYQNNAIVVPDSGYLWKLNVDSKIPALAEVSFPLHTLSKDIFTFIFFILTRSEEYNREMLDVWGRFKAENSMAFKGQYLNVPHVDLIKILIFDSIKKRWPSFKVPPSKFIRQITYDIDVAWAYLHRSVFRHIYGIIRDTFKKDLASLHDRWQVINHFKVDPFFTFSQLINFHTTLGDEPAFFILMGNKSKIDRAVGLKTKAFRQLIRDLSARYKIGLHPSKRSGSHFHILKEEYELLGDFVGKPIKDSRQHYLLMRFPETYRKLIELGIENDYSMGYASKNGFRAGTCFPFKWFDVERDVCTNLTVHPFQAMDVTFWVYGYYTPKKVLAELEFLENECKSVGGTFTFIAHNSSFAGPGSWHKWKDIYFAFLKNENL